MGASGGDFIYPSLFPENRADPAAGKLEPPCRCQQFPSVPIFTYSLLFLAVLGPSWALVSGTWASTTLLRISLSCPGQWSPSGGLSTMTDRPDRTTEAGHDAFQSKREAEPGISPSIPTRLSNEVGPSSILFR